MWNYSAARTSSAPSSLLTSAQRTAPSKQKPNTVSLCNYTHHFLRHSYEGDPNQSLWCCRVYNCPGWVAKFCFGCIVFNICSASTAYYYGKKRKLSKPTAGEETAEGELAKPTRRRKKRKAIFVQKKRRSSAVDYTPAGSPQVRKHLTSSLLPQSFILSLITSVLCTVTQQQVHSQQSAQCINYKRNHMWI